MADDNKVVKFPGLSRLDLPAERILSEAAKAGLTSVVVIGYDAEEDEYFASSIADGGTVIWLMERLKKKLLEYPDGEP